MRKFNFYLSLVVLILAVCGPGVIFKNAPLQSSVTSGRPAYLLFNVPDNRRESIIEISCIVPQTSEMGNNNMHH